MGKFFGGPQHIEKQIDELDAKGSGSLTQTCKDIYCAITGNTEEDLRPAFQVKGWVGQANPRDLNPSGLFGRRKKL